MPAKNIPPCVHASFLPDRRCPGNSRTCDPHPEGNPEFTWSLVAAGDLREERNEKTEKKAGSPQGWEEGKNEGITFPRCAGISFFNKLPQSAASHALMFFAHVELYKECIHLLLFFQFCQTFFGAVHNGAPLCSQLNIFIRQNEAVWHVCC